VIGWEQLFTGCTNQCLVLCQPAELNAAGTQPSLIPITTAIIIIIIIIIINQDNN